MVKESNKEQEILKEAVKKVQKTYGLRVINTERIKAFVYKVKINTFEFILTCGKAGSTVWFKLRNTEDLLFKRAIARLGRHFGIIDTGLSYEARLSRDDIQVNIETLGQFCFIKGQVAGQEVYDVRGMNILDILQLD